MAGDVVRFVDSVAASPTVRLDLNDEVSWWVRSFKAPPPRLRRSQASNAMRDGIHVGSSSYGERILTLELETIKSTQDAGATEIQKLWRELDRADNFLMYQPTGATKPVFFRLYRSDASTLEDVIAQAAHRTITVELLAEPFALGLKETLGPYVVNYDPAAGSNPGYVDLPTILGDVPADIVYWDAPNAGSPYQNRIISMHSGPAATVTGTATFRQAESAVPTLDTSNPGGAADAALSGSGTTNYLRTTFASNATMQSRASDSVTQPAGGTFRVIAAVRRTATTSTLRARLRNVTTGHVSSGGTVLAWAGRSLVDLGVVSWPGVKAVGAGGVLGTSTLQYQMQAERVGGTDNLDWDVLSFFPAGGQEDGSTATVAIAGPPQAAYGGGADQLVLDGSGEQAYYTTAGVNPTTSASVRLTAALAGGFPRVSPGLANRLYVLSHGGVSVGAPVGGFTTVNLAYWPRYLLVRPVST